MSVVDKVTEQLALIELKGNLTYIYSKKKRWILTVENSNLDDDISEYITGIIEDESMEDDEKREVISEFLSEATVSLTWTHV